MMVASASPRFPAARVYTHLIWRSVLLLQLCLLMGTTNNDAKATAFLPPPTTTRLSSPHNSATTQQDGGGEHVLENEYKLTEQMLTERGLIEEMLMSGIPAAPLLPVEAAASAPTSSSSSANQPPLPSRGFGGSGAGKKKKKKKKNSKQNVNKSSADDEAKHHATVLKNEGLVRIDGVLSDAVTDELREFVYGIRADLTRSTSTASNPEALQDKFPTIRRWDLSIPLLQTTANITSKGATTTTTIAYQALQDVLRNTIVGETMSHFLGTDQAPLYEFSSYISDPGSTRQVLHADTPCAEEGPNNNSDDDQPILCTCFIALQDVRMDMGPTIWIPKTNTPQMHDLFFGEEDAGMVETPRKDRFLQTSSSVVGVIPKGSCVLFDSRLIHCGTANKSKEDSRALLFFSFQSPDIQLENPGGDVASIRPDIKGRFRLSDFISGTTTT